MSQQLSPIESAKRQAATQAVDEFVKDGMTVGIGSGSTVVYVVDRLVERVRKENLTGIVCVPTSFQAIQLITEGGLTLSDLSRTPELDVCIDGADEVDAQLNLIKGGGGCQTQEKIVASCAKRFIVVADYRKDSAVLGEKWKKGVPLEVVPMAYQPILNKIKSFGGVGKIRMAQSKAGPVVTDNGNMVIDADFGLVKDPADLNDKLLRLPGIVETGLFINMAEKVFIGNKDGSVVTYTRAKKSPL